MSIKQDCAFGLWPEHILAYIIKKGPHYAGHNGDLQSKSAVS